MDKKFQIFISSPYEDLQAVRREVYDVVLKLGHFPMGMEMFGADDRSAWDVICSAIERCDLYILILGQRYGSLYNDNIGYTEKEYDYANEKGVPVLSFLQDENVATKPSERDDSEEKERLLRAFRGKIKAVKTVEFWESAADLARKVSTSISNNVLTSNRPGWIRGDSRNEEILTLKAANEVLKSDNAKLRLQIEQAAGVNERRPDICVMLNGERRLSLKFNEYEERLQFIQEIHTSVRGSLINLDGSDNEQPTIEVPRGIQEYNRAVREAPEAVERYNRELEERAIIHANLNPVSVAIMNNGTKPGNDIYVEVVFPDEIKVYRSKPVIPAPEMPSGIPTHPYSVSSNFLRFAQAVQPNPSELIRRVQNVAGATIGVDDNMVKIELQSLVHTRTKQINDEVFIAPLKRGVYTAVVKHMCVEYVKPVFDEFIIEVF